MNDTSEHSLISDMRAVFRQLASTVAIITTHHEGNDFGMTATSLTSVSMHPPTILACVNRASRLHAAIMAAGKFTANFLAQDQAYIAERFGTPNHPDRFSVGEWKPDDSGARLIGSAAQLVCELTNSFQSGTHSILIGAVQTAQTRNRLPLLYRDGNYTRLAPPPAGAVIPLTAPVPP